MSDTSPTKRERAFVASVQAELAGGTMQFDRETVRRLIAAYNREAYRFDYLATDIAFHMLDDDSHLPTMYGEFASMRKRLAEADAVGMRDQIERHDATEAPDGT
ncbi:MAG: hypothetical protein OEV43_00520 [Coriobacteriia bacterium]|nr:hypothetical protein [Coriobacteriia bacterium]